MKIEVTSAGYEHGNEFKVRVDGKEIEIEGERGMGLVVMDEISGKVKIARMFDTSLDPSQSSLLNQTILQYLPLVVNNKNNSSSNTSSSSSSSSSTPSSSSSSPSNTTAPTPTPYTIIILGVKGDAARSLSLDLIQTISLLGSKLIHNLSIAHSWAFIARLPHSSNSHSPSPSPSPSSSSSSPTLFEQLLPSSPVSLSFTSDHQNEKSNEGNKGESKSSSYSIHYLPPNPTLPLASSIPPNDQSTNQNTPPVTTIPSIPLSHLTHPPLNYQSHHHPTHSSIPPSQGETLLHHRVKRDHPSNDHPSNDHPPSEHPSSDHSTNEGGNDERGLKGGSERGREKEREEEKKGERIEHSPDDLYHHSHPYHIPPRPQRDEEDVKKYDVPPVDSVHHRHSTTGGQGVNIGMSVRNNRARRRDTIS